MLTLGKFDSQVWLPIIARQITIDPCDVFRTKRSNHVTREPYFNRYRNLSGMHKCANITDRTN